MSVFNLKTAALVIATGVSLGGCAYGSYGPYGGVGVGVGYSSGYYDPYYNGRYYAGGGYGYPGYGYGYGSPYYGWYNGYYYPGTGYYVYDRHRRAHRWNDAQRRYWEHQRGVASSNGGAGRIVDNWADFHNGPRSRSGNNVYRHRNGNVNANVNTNHGVAEPVARNPRVQPQTQRRTARTEVQGERRGNRGGRNRQVDND